MEVPKTREAGVDYLEIIVGQTSWQATKCMRLNVCDKVDSLQCQKRCQNLASIFLTQG